MCRGIDTQAESGQCSMLLLLLLLRAYLVVRA